MTAIISECGRYRYLLTRKIPQAIRWIKPCLFIMLNPSTADAEKDDPTIRRCKDFARQLKCTELTVCNLFSYRTPSPKELLNAHKSGIDIVGPENERHLIQQIEKHSVGEIVCAWGSNKLANQYAKYMKGQGFKCLGINKDGSPKHPLYLKKQIELAVFK